MSEQQHTPGPWELGPWICAGTKPVYRVVKCNGRSVSAISVYGARINGSKSGRRNVSEGECDANARLIAASPDLLDSLTNLVGLAEMRGGQLHEYKAALDDAHAAIAKATGTTP